MEGEWSALSLLSFFAKEELEERLSWEPRKLVKAGERKVGRLPRLGFFNGGKGGGGGTIGYRRRHDGGEGKWRPVPTPKQSRGDFSFSHFLHFLHRALEDERRGAIFVNCEKKVGTYATNPFSGETSSILSFKSAPEPCP